MVGIQSVNKRTKCQRPPGNKTESARPALSCPQRPGDKPRCQSAVGAGGGASGQRRMEKAGGGRLLNPPPPQGHLPGPGEVPRRVGTSRDCFPPGPSTGASPWSVTGPWHHGGNPTVLVLVILRPCGASGTLKHFNSALCPDQVLPAHKDTITVTWPQPPHSAPLSANKHQGPGRRRRGWEGDTASAIYQTPNTCQDSSAWAF